MLKVKYKNSRYFHKIKIYIANYLCAFIIFISVVAFWLFIQISNWSLKSNKTIVINRGTSIENIASIFHKNGGNKYTFIIYYKIKKILNKKMNIKAGEYEFLANERINDVLTKLNNGKVKRHKITIPEGLTNYQILQILKLNSKIEFDLYYGLHTNKYLLNNGQIMPDTYDFTLSWKASQIIDIMYKSSIKFEKTEWILRDKRIDSLIKNYKEALILASIVEKETKIKSEQAIIAGVYLNRLKKKCYYKQTLQ
ncbi:YceG-like super family N-terminal domain protein [Lyticum sinuosum]|uniref:YceG-like super family N-terminal domain protein n=1 Tax=Lyticum sinuosum TaxID=1332059 RepID=A0AAE4VMB7_9RICK|nr:YceG-like super family N-terminal domain protein [Lyticum sinuosum]